VMWGMNPRVTKKEHSKIEIHNESKR